MANKPNLSIKHLAIDKANATLVLVVAITSFIVVFSLVASKSLFSQFQYQSKVIKKQEVTLRRVERNKQEVEKLKTAYAEFDGSTQNVLGGNPKGNGEKDGQNAKIILDALPSKYDFPALATSIDKLVAGNGFKLKEFTGTDDEVAQAGNNGSVSPQAVSIPFNMESEVANADGKKLMENFEKSIRPFQVQKMTITSQGGTLKIGIVGNTYFQPEKKMNVTQETVKK